MQVIYSSYSIFLAVTFILATIVKYTALPVHCIGEN